jgi:hypothetical protein
MTLRYRIINGIVWLYLWLSQVMLPVVTDGDFWSEKGKQLFRFGPFDDPVRLTGRAIIPLVLWVIIDWIIRRQNDAPLLDAIISLGASEKDAREFLSGDPLGQALMPKWRNSRSPSAADFLIEEFGDARTLCDAVRRRR